MTPASPMPPDSAAPFRSVMAQKHMPLPLATFLLGVLLGMEIVLDLIPTAHAQTTIVDPGAGAAAVASAGTNDNPLLMLLALIPQPYAGYLISAFSVATTIVTVASLLVAKFPAPTTTSGAWYYAYTIINWLAFNFGHAQSLSAPASKGIVGGPGATTAPLVATGVVPLVVATPAQKAVTVMPAAEGATPLPPAPPAADIAAGHQAAAAFEAQKQAALGAPAPQEPAPNPVTGV